MNTVNIGILAHVDAGKTSLTERLLYSTGVIDRIGRVDDGDTQTDAHELERRRGITIRSAVVSFTVGDTKVNLIDTPGHPDFISEVERALGVLDGVILVISAVEGVQAQTRLLMRTLARIRMPVIIFVNKIDRAGARYGDLLESIRTELAPSLVAMTRVEEPGTRQARALLRRIGEEGFTDELAEVLAEHDDRFLARFLGDGPALTAYDYTDELVRQTGGAWVCPVFFGSAVSGAGIPELTRAVTRFFAGTPGQAGEGLRATVFKIERGWAGEKIAYARVHSGKFRARTAVSFYRRNRQGALTELTGRASAVEVFDEGSATAGRDAVAGDIAKVRGLKGVRIGDQVGTADGLREQHLFASPSLESIVKATAPGATPDLYEALSRLADQDPLINVRKDDSEQEIAVSLYGEVQKEVIKATLAEEYKLDVEFEGTRTICVERPAGTGEAVEEIDRKGRNLFWATVGLRVEPGEVDSGIVFRRSVEVGSLPHAFHKAIEESVRSTLAQGLYGWEVIDIVVTLTHSGFAAPVSAAGDFRKLTPLVLMNALRQAGTRVLEPVNAFEVEVPAENISSVLLNLVECGGTPHTTTARGSTCLVDGVIPARTVQDFEQQLPGLTQGEGTLHTRFHSFQPAPTPAPVRRNSGINALDRKEYMLRVSGRI
ncbi:GTP-binding protein [Streptomyces albipurpureus]|uniref:TetM/TetW/TetO/TetS family tetracycline resistance ribosomal protection protein n=1 Tax=Streptomyces albipurpureus TaxID=2897419 RepID=A0ABT0UQ58_9ACTN|nr:TetM/TetW/TetO/TetS family tetracycline resistance ribosomal protection protein [Streptomyces sp. CWNU-1]MCM2390754.1 TetM/TetW/TetO/TetS family tetracycline resistance ribosomal protection protein [Streptomyces sp. CWNU-1]